MRSFISIIILCSFSQVVSQVFEPGEIQQLIKRTADHIYNDEADSARIYIDKVEQLIPAHPVVPMMRAMNILWSNIPTISEETFGLMQQQLDSTVYLAEESDRGLDDPEMTFFAMSAHGLLAEYYADQDQTLKAVGQAGKAYGLLKEGFDLVDEHPQFFFATGLYNYFRVRYPEKHPIYKPLLWFFRGGDKELGLEQLEYATEQSFTKVEAYVYLSYIYLRYEYKPKKAQEYLSRLCTMYPNNFYAKAKYLESLANPEDFSHVPLSLIYSLIEHRNAYYKMAGYVFLGYYEEMVVGNNEKGETAYRKGLEYGGELPDHGEFFKSFGYLGLARILVERGEMDEAKRNLNLSLKFSETEQVETEAKELLSRI